MNFFIKCIFLTLFIYFIYSPISVGENNKIPLEHGDTTPTEALQMEACKNKSTSISNYPNRKLIWHDEFNCLDTTKWNREDWASDKNNELQYYSPTNISINNGFLHIISKKEKFKGREFTSGALTTKDKFEVLYGKVEIRAKLPAGQGIFPAFWMITDNEKSLPEIDTVEMLGQKPTEIWMVVHWYDNRLRSNSTSFIGPNFSQSFHTFSIEWIGNSISFAAPYGEYNPKTLTILKELDVKMAFTIESGYANPSQHILEITRQGNLFFLYNRRFSVYFGNEMKRALYNFRN